MQTKGKPAAIECSEGFALEERVRVRAALAGTVFELGPLPGDAAGGVTLLCDAFSGRSFQGFFDLIFGGKRKARPLR
jgi:hypothetical protein